MRLRADQQLFLSYLILISLLTLALGVGADSVLRRSFLATLEGDLQRELVLARAIYDAAPTARPDSLARLIGSLAGRQVTIVGFRGGVLGDSADEGGTMPLGGDLRTRPEIRMALDTGSGRSIRAARPGEVENLYLATRTADGSVIRLAAPLSEMDDALARVQTRIFGVGAAGVLLAAFFAYGFGTLVSRPLRHIRDVARDLASGNLSRRVRMRRDDDLGDLGNALDRLADELERRLGQLEGERAEMQALIDSMSEGVLAFSADGRLRRSNPAARRMFALGGQAEGIPPEMVSRRPDFLELVAAALGGNTVPPRELGGDGRPLLATAHPLPRGGAMLVFLDISELRRLEGVRRDFVANASHELKTPLTAIRGYSETLLESDLPHDLVRRFAGVVKQNAERLQQIVDDLLDLSRIEAGALKLQPAPVLVEPLAREVWAAQPAAGKVGSLELQFDIEPGNESVFADRGALHQILANLFSNALRYTEPGGVITLRTRSPGPGAVVPVESGPTGYRATRWTVVEVSDTGVGIPAAHLSRIFERFYRVDPARSREEGGTGLGLSIVKHLVEAHGGWVAAESEVGRGTTIRFLLPGDAEARA